MTTHSDRKDIGTLRGMPPPNYRDASAKSAPWKKPATPIMIPTNTCQTYRVVYPGNQPRPGSNPFNANPNSRFKNNSQNVSVGNPTSKQTIFAGSSRQEDLRPTKRPRLDKPPESVFNSANRGTGFTNGNRRPPIGREQEVIVVDEEGTNGEVPQERETMRWNRQSSDELNLISDPSTSIGQTSRFSFGLDNEGKAKRSSGIAQDGLNTLWVDETFGHGHGDLKSDPIENDSDVGVPFTRGRVGRAVEKINARSKLDLGKANEKPPRIDLSKPPGKRVMKPKRHSDAKNLNPFASSSNPSRTVKEHGPLPVKEAYLDAHFYPESARQKMEVFWTSDHKVIMKANESQVLSLSITSLHCKSMHYSKYIEGRVPIIQLEPISRHELVAIKFDVSSPEWTSKKYEQFLNSVPPDLEKRAVANGDSLWQIAERSAIRDNSGGSNKANDVGVHSRMEELEEIHERKTHNLQPVPRNRKRKAPSDYTASGSPSTDIPRSKNGSSEQKSRPPSMTRRNTDQEAGLSNIRRSTRNTAAAKVVQAADQDEVILVYPQGTPGAVNVTNADLRRLDPGEFLNDTLIEFGLKLWLKELEHSNPELASQIHVFNSFFYKKLNHKDPQQAYESVRKWTSKFDIFQKKYIIVPINEHLHWYLAIIYEPEHVLFPTVSETPLIRKQTRSSTKTAATDPAEANADLFDDKDDQNVTPSEAEVERNLNDNFQNSCTIENLDNDELLLQAATLDDDDSKSSAALSYVSEEGDKPPISNLRQDSPATSIAEQSKGNSPRSASPNDIVPDSTEEIDPAKGANNCATVDSASFYQRRPKNHKGKDKAMLDPDIHMVDVEQDSDEVVVISSNEPSKTYIFTMDSLGTRHPQAIKRLANYLKLEAQGKKGVLDASLAMGKFALVPVQPNFCDCGVYLLHFAQTFMTNPKQYCKSILSQQKSKSITNKDKQDVWHDHKVGDMREDLADRIRHLSDEWKKSRVASGESRKSEQVEGNNDVEMDGSGESDVELVERSPVKKASPVKKSAGPAKRMRGN